jgi:hypothetical protein
MSESAAVIAPSSSRVRLGRPFVSPAFDLLVIGGGLSLVMTAALAGGLRLDTSWIALPVLILLCNSAHFAASTVRLYARPGIFERSPFLTMGLPLVAVLVVTAGAAFPGDLGRHLQALYLTWSPYHYAAQAYGLALMYSYRTGFDPTPEDKRWVRAACLAPFLFVVTNGQGAGLDWVLPSSVLANPAVAQARQWLGHLLYAATLALPFAAFLWLRRREGGGLPLISLTTIFANGVWWTFLVFREAFVWATVFHGLQYMAIVSIFFVRDRAQATRGTAAERPWWTHALLFYGACLVLGYLLFQVWPQGYVAAGFGYAESVLIVTAIINIHHFIVDAYIWRLRKDPNYAIVTAGAPA